MAGFPPVNWLECAGELSFQRVIVTSPPSTLADGIELAGFCSSIVYDGIDYRQDEVVIQANDFHFSKKRLIASHAIPNWGFPHAFTLLKEKLIPAELLLTHTFSLQQLEKAFAVFGDETEKVIKPVVVME